VKAYALEQQKEGGLGLREVDLLNQPDVWGGHFDGDNFYVGVGVRYEGENIKSVDFTTAKGFFAKQYINKLSDGEGISEMYVGADNRLVMYADVVDTSKTTLVIHQITSVRRVLKDSSENAKHMLNIKI